MQYAKLLWRRIPSLNRVPHRTFSDESKKSFAGNLLLHSTAPRVASAFLLAAASGSYFYGQHALQQQEHEREAARAELFRCKIREELRDLNERKDAYDNDTLNKTTAMGRDLIKSMRTPRRRPIARSRSASPLFVKNGNGVLNESERQRQVQESDRVEAETERVENELQRINNGLAMIQEENKRLANEVDRQTEERKRVATELKRVDGEMGRIQERDGIREAEQNRMTHEQLRQTREIERVQAELRRIEQESSRSKRVRDYLKKTSFDTQLLLQDLRSMVHQDHQGVSDQMSASVEGMERLLESLGQQQKSSPTSAKGTNLQQLTKEHEELQSKFKAPESLRVTSASLASSSSRAPDF